MREVPGSIPGAALAGLSPPLTQAPQDAWDLLPFSRRRLGASFLTAWPRLLVRLPVDPSAAVSARARACRAKGGRDTGEARRLAGSACASKGLARTAAKAQEPNTLKTKLTKTFFEAA